MESTCCQLLQWSAAGTVNRTVYTPAADLVPTAANEHQMGCCSSTNDIALCNPLELAFAGGETQPNFFRLPRDITPLLGYPFGNTDYCKRAHSIDIHKIIGSANRAPWPGLFVAL